MNRTYAIGDIHGCCSELTRLLEAIAAHATGAAYGIVCLGDYIDKGPDSAGVLDFLMQWPMRSSVPLVCIKGNHDDVMAASASDAAAAEKWQALGGDAVLAQYGVKRAADLPADVLGWLDALPTWHDDGLHYFVHAGVDPLLPLDAQTDATRMSMRGAFLRDDHDFGRYIVHGHTPQLSGEPELRKFRCDLDTNVSQTGRLTAAMFDDRPGGPATIIATTSADGIEIRDLRHAFVLS